MEIIKDEKTNTFTITGITEGKMLRLQNVMEKDMKETKNPLSIDIYTAIRKAVCRYISFGTRETD